MKKLILPIGLLLLFLLFPFNISAQSARDKYQSAKDKCIEKKYDECNKKYQSYDCGSNVGANYVKWAACQESLLGKIEKCQEEIASEYKPCLEAKEASEPTPESTAEEPTPIQTQQPTKSVEQGMTDKDGDPNSDQTKGISFPVFIGGWFKLASDLIQMQLGLSGFVDMYVEHRSPVDWPKTYLKKDPNDLSDMPKPWPDVQIKLPQQNNWSNLKQEDPIPPGSTISGPGPFKVGIEGATILAPGTSGQTTITTPDPKDSANLLNIIYLQEGEIEIQKPDTGEGSIFGIETPSATVTVVHTHFLVAFNKKTKETTIAVYDGEVDVKTKDGKKIAVSPDGDKPGVVVISQKLSFNKLALAGLVLVVVIGGAILVLRRKLTSKGFSKKKK